MHDRAMDGGLHWLDRLEERSYTIIVRFASGVSMEIRVPIMGSMLVQLIWVRQVAHMTTFRGRRCAQLIVGPISRLKLVL